MVNEIYDQLKCPKTLEELHQRLGELGLKWNKAQVELFLSMDKSILKIGNTFSVGEISTKDTILEIIEKTIGEKPMIPIKKVLENIPIDTVASAEKILKVALNSGKYISPNGAVLKKVN
ncbi:hypothetical protein [Anaeromicropila herbilytica]|uniref:Uncharacterized protein n=1 Tax=Anaeromicropila herbilytica TaxID=2785025 RepID=A0A7R7IDK6_9FIRM|nr:hypothetical protein [Anaeromicropila herbilytica]BCN30113.1 hypothetical protein bsdtb5_14080 [Anaeromicropila herbilytica]